MDAEIDTERCTDVAKMPTALLSETLMAWVLVALAVVTLAAASGYLAWLLHTNFGPK